MRATSMSSEQADATREDGPAAGPVWVKAKVMIVSPAINQMTFEETADRHRTRIFFARNVPRATSPRLQGEVRPSAPHDPQTLLRHRARGNSVTGERSS
jgi:hypothetical protein